MKPLTPTERRTLRAQAHHLDPVVIVGQHGLTAPVLREIGLAIAKHELVKVRVASEARPERDAMLETICADLDCAPVQHLGRVLTVWRPNPEKKKAAAKPAPKTAKTGKSKLGKSKLGKTKFSMPKTRGPRTPLDPVRERRRSTRGAARNLPPEAASPVAPLEPATRTRRRRG